MPSHAALLLILMFTVFQPDETLRRYGGAEALWQVETLAGAAFPAHATLSFPARNIVSGDGPCNQYNSTNSTPYPWIALGPIAATRRSCPDLAVEQAYFQALSKATIVLIEGDRLTLSDETGELLQFKAIAP